jgi:hypothetical protein
MSPTFPAKAREDSNNDEEWNKAMDAWMLNEQEMLLTHAKKYLAMIRRRTHDLIHCQEELMKDQIQQLPGKLVLVLKDIYYLRADKRGKYG